MTFPWVGQLRPGSALQRSGRSPDLLPSCCTRPRPKSPQAPALAFFGRTLTYGDLADQTARLAQAFKNMGVAPGERFAFLLPNCPQLVVAYHAALRLGAVAVPLNPLLSPKELDYQVGGLRGPPAGGPGPLPAQGGGGADPGRPGPGDRHRPYGLSALAPEWLYPLKARRQGLATGFKPGPAVWHGETCLSARPWRRGPPARPPGSGGLAIYRRHHRRPQGGGLDPRQSPGQRDPDQRLAPPGALWPGKRLVGLLPFSHSFGLTVCLNWPLSQGAMIIVLPRFEIKGF